MTAPARDCDRAQEQRERAAALEVRSTLLDAHADRLRTLTAEDVPPDEAERLGLDALGEGWHVLYDRRRLPGSPGQLDHVVVGPPGVLVLHVKRWAAGVLVRDEQGLAVARWRKDDVLPAVHADREAVAWHVGRSAPQAPVGAAVAFVHDMGLDEPVQHHGAVLLQGSQLVGWLRALPSVLAPAQVEQLAASLLAALPERGPVSARDVVPAQRPPSAPADPGGWTAYAAVPVTARRRAAGPARAGRRGPAPLRRRLVRAAVALVLVCAAPTALPWLADEVVAPAVEAVSGGAPQ